MSTEKVDYKEAFINFNPQKFCDQLALILSKKYDCEATVTAEKKEKTEA